MYRKDREALFRWDSRGPEIIFREGFRNRNNLAPSSFQYYQNNHTESALVSFSRDPDPDAARPDWARAEGNHSYRYLAFPPGGYDFVASLGTASIANQDEVALWKGSLGKYVARVEVFNADDELVGRLDNPRASSGTKAALAEWDRREASREQYGAEESADLSSEQTYANVPNNQAAPHAQGYGYNSTGQTAVHSQGYENFPTNPMAAHVLGSQVQFSQRGPIQYSNSQPQAHGSRETRQQYEQYDASQNAQSATGARNGRRGRRR
ncbi:hypothetical protein [Streptomyces sp. NPDC006289]|uniref:scabin-related ADP-ribosyltransferase n=1 Tax=Streptomyces sp. NPDC006289 TaxID=3156744 RepID=UPI0033A43A3D